MRYREGGSAFAITISIILLCLITAIGVTFELFKDDTEDGKIGVNVTTGKVKVDIVDTEQNSLVGDVLDFMIPGGNDTLYFEPGMTCYTQGFQVKNVGDIAVNYHVNISEDETVDKAKFEEAFELYITNDTANLGTAEKLTAFTGSLEANQNSETYYLVVKMKETAGNEFQDKTYTGIGITVHVVQSKAEAEE